MEKQEILKLIDEIGTCEDEAERRSKLNTMRDSVSEVFNQNEELTTQNEKFSKDNENLRQYNMDLFLQLGSKKTPDEKITNETGVEHNEEEPKIKFTDLYNEKGELI